MANAGTGNAVPATNVFSQNAGAAPVNGDMPGFTKEQLDAGSAFWATAPTAEAIAEAAQRNNLTAEQVASSWAQSGYGSYDQGLQNIGQYMQSVQPTTPAPVTPPPVQPTAPAATTTQQPQAPNIFNTAATGITNAINTATGATAFKPMMINAGTGTADVSGYVDKINATPVTAGQISGTDLSAYMNPYETQVVDRSLSDLDRARQMQARQLNAQATQAGAFGGSRQALMQSELGRNYLDQAARTASGLRQSGFQNAQQLAGQDIASRMQADLANQGASLQSQMTNAQLAQQINLANQAARNSMSQFNLGNQLQASMANQGATLAGSQQQLAAAGQLGSLSNLGFGMGMDLQNQAMQQGALERGINQLLLNAAKEQYAGATNAPAQSLAYLNQAVAGAPAPTTTTQSRDPGLFDYLTLAASMYPRPGA